MFAATRVLRQAAAHAERTPSIRFLGRRTTPSSIDHSPQPHPASPTGALPEGFTSGAKHSNFSSYRQHAQQHGPLQKSIRAGNGEPGIGGLSGHEMGSVRPAQGEFFDRSELPARFRRQAIPLAELEAVESGGASLFG
ncbi:hypothetical protein HYQ45_008661 [Verticillium longisporum]|uniref:Ribosomal protein YMR-31 n=1 Tax=Verticillium longisporum TaxID=100787 RepID=A0A0G4LZ73_VERLO|nr:hypothetical protein HYQ44_015248 [Verticillium longisporum]KAG7133124.1 hypothetical protein HYQ45_008661 [Verticillium longisporum]KAG7136613.1 hypothetical protein HYQ46_008667 [Verticillium longisporum]CRK27356.1 hypothetical protein BN1708_014769 [Verticillium longisporum]